jgi:uncharacterized protein YdiU (UPF0061 family)
MKKASILAVYLYHWIYSRLVIHSLLVCIVCGCVSATRESLILVTIYVFTVVVVVIIAVVVVGWGLDAKQVQALNTISKISSLCATPSFLTKLSSRSSRYICFNRFARRSSARVMATTASKAISLYFDNRILRDLPVDRDSRIRVSRQVPNAIFSLVQPAAVESPKLVSLSPSALSLLGLPKEKSAYYSTNMELPPLGTLTASAPASSATPSALPTSAPTPLTLADYLEMHLSGNAILPGSTPAAHCYCGHQFGSFSGQLGDGAAMYLGEVVVPEGSVPTMKAGYASPTAVAISGDTASSELEGKTGGPQRWELQLKGAGQTPYSRGSDGRKVLRSSIREFLCSEAMFALGIASTRAGTVITSDSRVIRDPHYDGNAITERCTIVSRIAPSFLRFGSFEIFKTGDDGYDGSTGRSGPSPKHNTLKKQLLDYVVTNYYSDVVANITGSLDARQYEAVFEEILKRTALLVAQWQAVGFVHGVLNTDNMSILGLTIGNAYRAHIRFSVFEIIGSHVCGIDYGPYGFMEHFDSDFVPNGSDGSGRYRYSAQPQVLWHVRSTIIFAVQNSIIRAHADLQVEYVETG